MVTVTPGMTALWVSEIVPWSVPVDCACAARGAAIMTATTSGANETVRNLTDRLITRSLTQRLSALAAEANRTPTPKMQPRSHEDTKHARRMYSRAFFVVSCLRGKNVATSKMLRLVETCAPAGRVAVTFRTT